MEIKRVLERKTTGIKFVIIPKNSELKKGDYVQITKLEEVKNDRGKRK